MSEPIRPLARTASSEEIDLLELVTTLWQRKILIMLIAVLGFLGGYGISLLIPEQWRSTAFVVGPRIANTEELLEQHRAIERIINGGRIEEANLNRVNVTDIDVTRVLEGVFQTFLSSAADNDEKQSYLAGTDLFKRLLAKEKTSAAIVLDEIGQKITVELPDEKRQSLSMSYELSFVSDDAESAQATLAGYIDNINITAEKIVKTELDNRLDALSALHKQELLDIEQDVTDGRKVAIATYSDALKTAQQAGIKSANSELLGRGDSASNLVLEINTNPQQLYLQGVEVLQALLSVAQNEPLIYPKHYYRLKHEIEALEALKTKPLSFQTFVYQMRPTLPITRQSPKRAQLAVLGGVLGGVLGCLFVLISSALTNRRRQVKA